MPIRQVEMDDNLRIWRSFSIGSLFDLVMLDTRQYDRSITDLYWNTDYIHAISDDAGRTLMGARQEAWFYDSLSASSARGAAWRIIGSQTVFSRVNQSVVYGNVNPYNYDQWDGYQANRNRTLHHLSRNNISNNIVISGDSHANWVSDLLSDYGGNEYLGVEFAGTAISSPPPAGERNVPDANSESDRLSEGNPELQWNEMWYRGYFEMQISQEEVRALFFGLPTILNRNPHEIPIANFTVRKDENRLQRPVGGGRVETGSLKDGKVALEFLANDTETGQWFVTEEGKGAARGQQKQVSGWLVSLLLILFLTVMLMMLVGSMVVAWSGPVSKS
jgi:alkaline phosphatase D